MLRKILCGRNWWLVPKIGLIKGRFIHYRPEDTFNSAVIDRRYSLASSANPNGPKSISRGLVVRAKIIQLRACTASSSQQMAEATSSGLPMRPSGCSAADILATVSFCVSERVISVRVRPGATQFTRTPNRA